MQACFHFNFFILECFLVRYGDGLFLNLYGRLLTEKKMYSYSCLIKSAPS